MRDCTCSMRDGAHEWYCGKVGEYDFVHCRDCDGTVWMCGVAFSRCRKCLEEYERSKEYKAAEKEALAKFWEYTQRRENV